MYPPFLLLMWLRESNTNIQSALRWIGVSYALVWVYGSIWLSVTTIYHMFEKNQLFCEAVMSTLYDLRFKLAFVPVIGKWFVLDEDRTKNDQKSG